MSTRPSRTTPAGTKHRLRSLTCDSDVKAALGNGLKRFDDTGTTYVPSFIVLLMRLDHLDIRDGWWGTRPRRPGGCYARAAGLRAADFVYRGAPTARACGNHVGGLPGANACPWLK